MIAEEGRLLDLRSHATDVADAEARQSAHRAGSMCDHLAPDLEAYRIDFAAMPPSVIARKPTARHVNAQLQEKIGQLDRLNHELEDRVKERTLSLERSNLDLPSGSHSSRAI